MLVNAGDGPQTHELLSAGDGAFYGSNSPAYNKGRLVPPGGPQRISKASEGNKHWPWWQASIAAGRFYIPRVKPLTPQSAQAAVTCPELLVQGCV